MASALGDTLDQAMLAFFPLISRRLCSDQDPWINTYLERLIERRKKIFKLQGRAKSWKKVKKRAERLIVERKRGYLDYQVEKSSEKRGLGNRFAALTKPLSSVDKKPNFEVKDLCRTGSLDAEAAEECADYFSRISNEFTPIDLSRLQPRFLCLCRRSPGRKLRQGFAPAESRDQGFQEMYSIVSTSRAARILESLTAGPKKT